MAQDSANITTNVATGGTTNSNVVSGTPITSNRVNGANITSNVASNGSVTTNIVYLSQVTSNIQEGTPITSVLNYGAAVTSNFQANQSVTSNITTGGVGPAGPAGATGPAGNAGTVGSTGASGASGSSGPTGATGPQAATGATGPTGLTGPQGVKGIAGGDSFPYTYKTSTTDADPGAGNLRLNNATASVATQIYIDVVDSDGADVTAWLDNFTPGTVKIFNNSIPSSYANYSLTSVTVVPNYRKLNVTFVAGGGILGTGTGDMIITYATRGATGPQGLMGPQGFVGNDGATGPTGVTGPAGSPGGATGATGAVGATGAGFDSVYITEGMTGITSIQWESTPGAVVWVETMSDDGHLLTSEIGAGGIFLLVTGDDFLLETGSRLLLV